jgi:hypothetical protein
MTQAGWTDKKADGQTDRQTFLQMRAITPIQALTRQGKR